MEIPHEFQRTFTGKYIDVFHPRAEDICIEDIAHALSNVCRWSGHGKVFYSVAQHSLQVMEFVSEGKKLEALLHDATEAYIQDLPSPVKKRLPDYQKMEEGLMKAIAAKFGFEYPISAEVKEADRASMEFEWNYLILTISVQVEDPQLIEQLFLQKYKELTT